MNRYIRDIINIESRKDRDVALTSNGYGVIEEKSGEENHTCIHRPCHLQSDHMLTHIHTDTKAQNDTHAYSHSLTHTHSLTHSHSLTRRAVHFNLGGQASSPIAAHRSWPPWHKRFSASRSTRPAPCRERGPWDPRGNPAAP